VHALRGAGPSRPLAEDAAHSNLRASCCAALGVCAPCSVCSTPEASAWHARTTAFAAAGSVGCQPHPLTRYPVCPAAPPDCRADGEVERHRGQAPAEEMDYPRVMNNALPDDIRVLSWCPVPPDFSARWGPAGKCVCESHAIRLPHGACVEQLRPMRNATQQNETQKYFSATVTQYRHQPTGPAAVQSDSGRCGGGGLCTGLLQSLGARLSPAGGKLPGTLYGQLSSCQLLADTQQASTTFRGQAGLVWSHVVCAADGCNCCDSCSVLLSSWCGLVQVGYMRGWGGLCMEGQASRAPAGNRQLGTPSAVWM
jgi:hypothetical protein